MAARKTHYISKWNPTTLYVNYLKDIPEMGIIVEQLIYLLLLLYIDDNMTVDSYR